MTKSKAKGTTAEREVVRYFQNWWPAAERRALSGSRDRGDVAGIPGVCIEIKAAKTQLIGPWQREALTEMANAEASTCLLVVKRPYKGVAQWDAYMPVGLLGSALRGALADGERSLSWVRMDLALAAAVLRSQAF